MGLCPAGPCEPHAQMGSHFWKYSGFSDGAAWIESATGRTWDLVLPAHAPRIQLTITFSSITQSVTSLERQEHLISDMPDILFLLILEVTMVDHLPPSHPAPTIPSVTPTLSMSSFTTSTFSAVFVFSSCLAAPSSTSFDQCIHYPSYICPNYLQLGS